MSKDDDFWDGLKDLIDGGTIMLFIFGVTICAMAGTSLVGAMWCHDPEKIRMLTKIMDTLVGFIGGSFMTMWNNQHFKTKPTNGDGYVKTVSESNVHIKPVDATVVIPSDSTGIQGTTTPTI